MKQRHHITYEPPAKIGGFNLVNEQIDWAKWSWNPVTGCKHGCKYCYARDIANRFYSKNGFNPTFHKHRLKFPYTTKIPKKREKEIGIHNVFVCSMADLFGDWVPNEWINQILAVCKKTPQWIYIFLTKNPKRYLEFEFPENSWIGATGDTQKRTNVSLDIFSKLNNNRIKFLSCEPLLEPIKLKRNSIDWLIMDSQSKSSGAKEFIPPWKWFSDLISEAQQMKIKVYLP